MNKKTVECFIFALYILYIKQGASMPTPEEMRRYREYIQYAKTDSACPAIEPEGKIGE
jgi:hypothetical protein